MDNALVPRDVRNEHPGVTDLELVPLGCQGIGRAVVDQLGSCCRLARGDIGPGDALGGMMTMTCLIRQ